MKNIILAAVKRNNIYKGVEEKYLLKRVDGYSF